MKRKNHLANRLILALALTFVTIDSLAVCSITENDDGYVVIHCDNYWELSNWFNSTTDNVQNKVILAEMISSHPDKIKFSGYISNNELQTIFRDNSTINANGTNIQINQQSTVDMSEMIPQGNDYSFQYWRPNLQTAYLPTAATVTEVPQNCFANTPIKETPFFPPNIKRIKGQAFDNCKQLETATFPATLEYIESQAFNNLGENDTFKLKNIYVECWSTGCAKNAFDMNLTYAQTNMDKIFSNGTTLHFGDDENCGQVNLLDQYGNNTGFSYDSPFDYFVGDWKGDMLITQANLSSYYQNYDQNSGKGARNGWQEFALVEAPNIITFDHEILRTFSFKTDEGVLLPQGLTAYRAVDYQTTASDNGKTIEGYLVLVPLTIEINYHNQSRSFSYVPANTGVVLYGTVTSTNQNANAMAFMIPFDDLEDEDFDPYSWPSYPNANGAVGGAPYATYSTDGSNRTNYLVGSCADGLSQVTPVWPWPYQQGTVEYRNFALNKPNDVYRWVRIAPCQMPGNYAYAKIPASKFTNDNESADQSPYLDEEDQMGVTRSSVSYILCDGNYDPDAITDITSSPHHTDNAYYTLEGVRTAHPTKGIYIHQHKKVIIK